MKKILYLVLLPFWLGAVVTSGYLLAHAMRHPVKIPQPLQVASAADKKEAKANV